MLYIYFCNILATKVFVVKSSLSVYKIVDRNQDNDKHAGDDRRLEKLVIFFCGNTMQTS